MAVNHVTDRVDQTLQISPVKTKRLQACNHNSREISPAKVEKTASVSESDEKIDKYQLELTPQQLSHLAPLMKDGLKQNLTQRENESEEIDILIWDREIDFNVTHSNEIQHSNKKTSKSDIRHIIEVNQTHLTLKKHHGPTPVIPKYTH